VQSEDCPVRSSECSRNGGRGSRDIPIGTTNNGRASTAVKTRKSKVISRKRPIGLDDTTEVASDGTVEADLVAGDAVQVVMEESKAGVELLENDGLGLDFADLLEDYPLSHLLDDEQALLDDFDRLGVAD